MLGKHYTAVNTMQNVKVKYIKRKIQNKTKPILLLFVYQFLHSSLYNRECFPQKYFSSFLRSLTSDVLTF